jgi:hypothetical protein
MKFFVLLFIFIGSVAVAELTPIESVSNECRDLNEQLHERTLTCLKSYDGFTEPFFHCGNKSVGEFGTLSILFQDQCLSLTRRTLYRLCVRWEDNTTYTAESYCSQQTKYVP